MVCGTQLHDFLHVLTGYGATIPGELALAAHYLAQLRFPYHAIRLAVTLPRAILFPDGLLATHGGFPLLDLQQKLAGSLTPEELFAWLTRDECLQDFTWTRLTRYKRKSPNRLTKGCSFGYEDFESFCKLFPDGMPVRRMISGHEHIDGGWIVHPSYKINPACTLTGFGFPVIGGPADSARYRDKWLIARHRENDLPEPIKIPATPAEVSAFYSTAAAHS